MCSAELSAPLPPDSISVIAAVVKREHRYLLGRRPEGKRHGGLWEFPGGKLHDGEDLLGAARRELGEELALGVRRVGRELFRSRDPGSPFLIRFVEVVVEGTPRPLEHSEVGWFSPAELAELELAPADALFVRDALAG